MFLFDIKRIFSRDLQQNSLSEVNLSIQSEIFDLKRILLLFEAFFSPRNKRFFLRYEANFIPIWSDILYLNRMFLSEANLYCDMKQFFCEFRYLKRIFRFEAIFYCDIWSKFFTRFQAKSAIWTDLFSPCSEFLLRFEGNFLLRCEVKSGSLRNARPPPSGPPTEILRNLWVV